MESDKPKSVLNLPAYKPREFLTSNNHVLIS